MIRILALLSPLLLVAACGTPAVVTQRVEVPIPVRPIAPGDVPAAPVSEFARTGPADPVDHQVKALLIDHETVAAYAGRLRSLVDACVGPATPARLPRIE